MRIPVKSTPVAQKYVFKPSILGQADRRAWKDLVVVKQAQMPSSEASLGDL